MDDTYSPASSRPSPSSLPRDDCWSEEATFTLIESWGRRYIELNRGSLRQKHWQEVASSVNSRHFNTGRNISAAKSQPHRSDVQCKNRIDTLKKKYKLEKAKVSDEIGHVTTWPFFSQLDDLLNDNSINNNNNNIERSIPIPSPMNNVTVPVGPRSAITRRPNNDLLGLRGNLNAFAAAAAAAAASEDEEEESDGGRSSGGGKRKREEGGYKEVAEAIERLGEIYVRVEERKRKEMVEMEKQRMRFAKELECHRMHLFTELQVRLNKIRRSSGDSGEKGPASSASAALEYEMLDFPSYF